MTSTIEKLVDAEAKALQLFQTIETRKLIEAGKWEKQPSEEVFALAFELFGIEKYWH